MIIVFLVVPGSVNRAVTQFSLHYRIIYNDHIAIENIPLKAYEYVVNGKSVIEWIMERYAITIDKASQIKNDPNDWSREHEQPRYILDLLLSVIMLSCQTVDVINTLPILKI